MSASSAAGSGIGVPDIGETHKDIESIGHIREIVLAVEIRPGAARIEDGDRRKFRTMPKLNEKPILALTLRLQSRAVAYRASHRRARISGN